jgi:hypothetical protein
MKIILAICILALAIRAEMTTAAEIKFIGSDIISVSGRIEPGDHLTISPIVLRNMPDSTTIILNSQGGFGKAAFAIGRNIRARGLATKIPAGARCDSACRKLSQLDRHGVWRVLCEVAVPIGRATSIGRPWIWRLKSAPSEPSPFPGVSQR